MSHHKRRKSSGNNQWRVFKNDQIKAFNIQVIGVDGENLGVFTRAKALDMAAEAGADLVQLKYDPVAKVCTAKIVDFGKYMYEKKKAESEKKKVVKVLGQKEIKFGYNIGDHDLLMKVGRGKSFLEKGYTLRVVVMLKGREKVYRDIVRTKLDFVTKELEPVGRPQKIKEENFGFSLMVFSMRKKK